MASAGRHRLAALRLIAGTIAAGLALRLIPLGLPAWLVKYGGSALWAAMIYWLAVVAFPARPRPKLAFAAACTASLVEAFKLIHTPALDAFRLTLPGKLLLGRIFSVADIAVYLLAITLAFTLDFAWFQSPTSKEGPQTPPPGPQLRS